MQPITKSLTYIDVEELLLKLSRVALVTEELVYNFNVEYNVEVISKTTNFIFMLIFQTKLCNSAIFRLSNYTNNETIIYTTARCIRVIN